MKNPVEETKNVINDLIRYVDESPWRAEYLSLLKEYLRQADEPCVLAVAGRVSSGKSSFLNALLGKDLAKVGVCETTATINYFRYGMSPDPDRPVLIVWENGRETYESKEFLDSLQGNSEEVFRKASGIKQIEFFVADPILKEVTLVDTPGTDAITGAGGDTHEEVSATFFRLRTKHNEETKSLTSSADAVIYLTSSVANVSGQKFIQEFKSAISQGSSAMNAVGVMAKIDLEDGILQAKDELANSIAAKLRHELNTVIPVSAGLWRAIERLKSAGCLEEMQRKLKQIPEAVFDLMMDMEDQFLCEEEILWNDSTLPPLTVDERKALMNGLEWRVFVVLSRALYKYPLDEAIKRLTELSGMEKLKRILKEHFFERGRLLRCSRIVHDIYRLMGELGRRHLYETEKETSLLENFPEFVRSRSWNKKEQGIIDQLASFLRKHLKTREEIENLKNRLENELILRLERLQLELEETDKNFQSLQVVEGNKSLFTPEEREELLGLFGMYTDKIGQHASVYCAERQQYWIMEFFKAKDKERRKVAETAMQRYSQL